jgi:hypothetical protein
MYSVLALFLLIVAFAILVVTFLWVARLLGLLGTKPAEVDGDGDDGEDETQPVTDSQDLQEETPEPEAEEEEEDEAGRGQAIILGANYGLVLGILACILFLVSWLMLMLSAAAIGYSSRALYQGIRYYQLVVYRALIGFVLGLLSVGLQYLELTGQLAQMLTLLSG